MMFTAAVEFGTNHLILHYVKEKGFLPQQAYNLER